MTKYRIKVETLGNDTTYTPERTSDDLSISWRSWDSCKTKRDAIDTINKWKEYALAKAKVVTTFIDIK